MPVAADGNAVKGLSLEDICDWDTMLDHVAKATPSTEPGTEAHYHILSFGWIIGGIVRFVIRAIDSQHVDIAQSRDQADTCRLCAPAHCGAARHPERVFHGLYWRAQCRGSATAPAFDHSNSAELFERCATISNGFLNAKGSTVGLHVHCQGWQAARSTRRTCGTWCPSSAADAAAWPSSCRRVDLTCPCTLILTSPRSSNCHRHTSRTGRVSHA